MDDETEFSTELPGEAEPLNESQAESEEINMIDDSLEEAEEEGVFS